MSASAKPKGLSIKRSGQQFICSWKIGDKDYGNGQQFRYRINGGKWKSVDIGKTTTSKTISLDFSKYYPSTGTALTSFEFEVRGNRKSYTTGSGKNRQTHNPGWSSWVKAKYKFSLPTGHYAKEELTAPNQVKFSWGVDNPNDTGNVYRRALLSTALVKNCSTIDGSRVSGWSPETINTSASGSSSYADTVGDDSYTRWFRVRVQGLTGVTGYKYAYHIHANPLQPSIRSGSSATPKGAGTHIKALWKAPRNVNNRPVDSVDIEYYIGKPDAGMAVPSGINWSEVVKGLVWKQENDSFEQNINDQIDIDECLWIRVVSNHDGRQNQSAAYRAQTGKLKKPKITNLSQNPSTFRATLTLENESDVPDSKIVVYYNNRAIGIADHDQETITVQCPDWSDENTVTFAIKAFQGTGQISGRSGNVTFYTINANMWSDPDSVEGSAAVAPGNVTAVMSEDEVGEAVLTWEWTWKSADVAEISWSQNIHAWESTEEPETYLVSGINAARWRVSDLETGVDWYFRVRLGQTQGDDVIWGAYCEPVTLKLFRTPSTPALYLEPTVITADGSVTASWAYVTADGTGQSCAAICEATIENGVVTYGDIIANTEAAQHITINAADIGWETGETHFLCLQVTSAAGATSDGWSAPAAVYVAEPLSCEITRTSLGTASIVIDYDEEDNPTETRLINSALTEMPLTVAVSGAGIGGRTSVALVRAEPYTIERPDGVEKAGYEGETIALLSSETSGEFTFTNDDLIGYLDDGANYKIVATVQDALGQSSESSLDFMVVWEHKAESPTANVTIDDEKMVAFITPVAPDSYREGDVCDIYRLSTDIPELIISGAAFGQVYVDPYPAIGEFGGHRIVHRTFNNDFITANNDMGYYDTNIDDGDYFEGDGGMIINFEGNDLQLPWNVNMSNQWSKDFQLTSYLGGSQTGDWNPAITRKGTYSAVLWLDSDEDRIQMMRRLSDYAGICHIRTPEGSSFAADVQVSETKNYSEWEVFNYTLTVTRVDPEELDGITYEEWLNELE